jgi:hypothetical protein
VMGLRWVPLQVSWLAAAWLHKNFYVMIAAVLTLIGIGVYAVYDQIWQRPHTPRLHLLHRPLCAAFVAVVFFPAVLAFESIKLVLILPVVLAILPRTDSMPFYAITFSFYRRGLAKSRAEGMNRLKHILHYTIDVSAAKRRQWEHKQTPQTAYSHAKRQGGSRPKDEFVTFVSTSLHKMVESGRLQVWQYDRPRLDNSRKPPFTKPRETWQHFFVRMWPDFKATNKFRFFTFVFCVIWGVHLIILVVYSVLFNLAFPFVHVLRYGVFHLNVLQVTCLLFAGAALTTLIVLTPFMYRFITFTFLVKEFCDAFGWDMGPKEAKQASECVAEYHKPPHVAVLKAAIGIEVLPYDVAEGFVAPFVTIDDFNLGDLSAEECAVLKTERNESRYRPGIGTESVENLVGLLAVY